MAHLIFCLINACTPRRQCIFVLRINPINVCYQGVTSRNLQWIQTFLSVQNLLKNLLELLCYNAFCCLGRSWVHLSLCECALKSFVASSKAGNDFNENVAPDLTMPQSISLAQWKHTLEGKWAPRLVRVWPRNSNLLRKSFAVNSWVTADRQVACLCIFFSNQNTSIPRWLPRILCGKYWLCLRPRNAIEWTHTPLIPLSMLGAATRRLCRPKHRFRYIKCSQLGSPPPTSFRPADGKPSKAAPRDFNERETFTSTTSAVGERSGRSNNMSTPRCQTTPESEQQEAHSGTATHGDSEGLACTACAAKLHLPGIRNL